MRYIFYNIDLEDATRTASLRLSNWKLKQNHSHVEIKLLYLSYTYRLNTCLLLTNFKSERLFMFSRGLFVKCHLIFFHKHVKIEPCVDQYSLWASSPCQQLYRLAFVVQSMEFYSMQSMNRGNAA